tara:strand:- start:54 stop:299 length:246 start_codon:yes stop_codon:yes gene_type:complete
MPMSKNDWITLPKPKVEVVHNIRTFKSLADFNKSEQMRKENARNNKNMSAGAKVLYLSGKARMCNAEKLLQRGNKMTGYKI